MQVTNFGKYPMVEIGNPTQKSIRKCRIPILRNASQQKTGNPTEKGSDKYRLPNIEKYNMKSQHEIATCNRNINLCCDLIAT